MATTKRTTVKDTKETQNQVAQTTNAEQRGTTNRVPYISARIDRMSTDPNSKIRANASATIGNHFAIHGLKVYDGGDRGLQVLYPGHKGTDNKFYEDFHPVTKEAREALNGYVLEAYEQKLNQTHTVQQSEDADLEEDEEPAFEQTMQGYLLNLQ